jgi:hypothetical protein
VIRSKVVSVEGDAALSKALRNLRIQRAHQRLSLFCASHHLRPIRRGARLVVEPRLLAVIACNACDPAMMAAALAHNLAFAVGDDDDCASSVSNASALAASPPRVAQLKSIAAQERARSCYRGYADRVPARAQTPATVAASRCVLIGFRRVGCCLTGALSRLCKSRAPSQCDRAQPPLGFPT